MAPLLPKPKKFQIYPAGPMQLLANQKGELCYEDGNLWGYLQHVNPKMIKTDKESNAAASNLSSRSRKIKTTKLTYHSNMASVTAALASEDFQDTSSPIMFHRFDDIPVPCVAPVTFNFKITQGSILRILCKLGLLDGGANGGIYNGKDMFLMYFHPDGHRINISGAGNHNIIDWQLAIFCAVIEADLNGMICLVLGIFYNYAYVPEQVGTIH